MTTKSLFEQWATTGNAALTAAVLFMSTGVSPLKHPVSRGVLSRARTLWKTPVSRVTAFSLVF